MDYYEFAFSLRGSEKNNNSLCLIMKCHLDDLRCMCIVLKKKNTITAIGL